ncbi:ricin-type beta-trefoil lectin domain protein [Streptomyces sp. NPDC056600]|uniref:ricin-type beta-trefoil lectin domain protein n=1 Tax=Streptomyces sp. NPDC056600 TaxID=3345874 RepID=UPI0036BAA98E
MAATALLGLPAPGASAAPTAAASTPLPSALEAIRAAEAVTLYGDSAERPLDQRRTSLISLGDSEISGEGVGNYESPTDGPDNWCHRSKDAAIHRTGIPADVTYNVSCSGASTVNLRLGGAAQYADELPQSDNLAVKARNTKIKMIVVVVGANDDLRFGPVVTDCTLDWLLLQGPCSPGLRAGWQDRVDGLVPKVTSTVNDLRTVMRDAGYADSAYKLVLMGYPSPGGPDIRDNPDFPGKLAGGCTLADEDLAWARNEAVPSFERGIRQAARASGAYYLDNSRLFHGHEICMEETWVRGLTVASNPFPPDENAVRQSFHPNYRGHTAFAACFRQFYDSAFREGSCADPAGPAGVQVIEGAWDDAFRPLRNEATGTCLDAANVSSRNDTAVTGYGCHGQRNQDWWYDGTRRTVHTALSHDRCLDVRGGSVTAGTRLVLWDCHGNANQQFVRQSGTLRPASATGLCATLPSATADLVLRSCTGAANQRFA